MTNGKISDYVAIWIDHRIAIIVYFPSDRFQNGENLWVEEGPFSDEQGHSVQHRNGHRQEALKHFYNNIIYQLKHMVHVDGILIIGPGQAKYEFRRHIHHNKSLRGKIKNIRSAARMSEKELEAFASRYFAQLH
jgi:hypothetical protein